MTAKPALPPPDKAGEEEEVEASRAPLMDHLVELRQRLVRILWCIAILFCVGWFAAQPAVEILLIPFSDAARAHGREVTEVYFNAPLELLFIKLKLCFLFALAVGFPYIAYQIYAFVAPGLYKSERSAVLPFLFVMPLLFVAGALLVFYSVLPLFMDLTFEQEFKSATVQASYLGQIKGYYDLAISLLTAFGLAFQLPVVISLLARVQIVSAAGLRKARKYALVAILIVAAIMTPPDPFSQFVLGVPLLILYELGIWSAWLIERGRKRREDENARREAAEAKAGAAV